VSFPYAPNDDQVDATSQALTMLERIHTRGEAGKQRGAAKPRKMATGEM
jgi:hypothetical protein